MESIDGSMIPKTTASHKTYYEHKFSCVNGETRLIHRSEVLGWGAHGIISRGYLPDKKHVVAMKFFNNFDTDISARREKELLATLCHPCILNLIGHGQVHRFQKIPDESPIITFIVIPYAKYNIQQLITSRTKVKSNHIEYIAYSILSALDYMHSEAGVIHEDVSVGNILVTSTGRVILADLGAATDAGIDPFETQNSTNCVIYFRAPEVLLYAPMHDCRVDIWSLGIVLMSLISSLTIIHSSVYVKENRDDRRPPAVPNGTRMIFEVICSIEKLLGSFPTTWVLYKKLERDLPKLQQTEREKIKKPLGEKSESVGTLGQYLIDNGMNYSPLETLIRSMLSIYPEDRIFATDAMKLPIFTGKGTLCTSEEWKECISNESLTSSGIFNNPSFETARTLASICEHGFANLRDSSKLPGQVLRESGYRS